MDCHSSVHAWEDCAPGWKRTDGERGEKAGEPQFCITDILPHLGKDQMAKKLGEAFTGEDLNILAGSLPVGDEKASSCSN